MRQVHVIALIGMLLAGVLAGGPAGAAGTLHTLFTVVAEEPSHIVGTTATLYGVVCVDCSSDSTANTGTVDLSFRGAGGTAYGKVGSTTVGHDGSFQLAVPFIGSGTYRAVYRGTASATPVTLTASEISYEVRTVTVTVFSHTVASCGSPCSYAGGTVPVDPGPVAVTLRQACHTGMTVGYGTAVRIFPAAVPGTPFDLTPNTGLGHFSVTAGGGCGWSLTATQTHTRLVQA